MKQGLEKNEMSWKKQMRSYAKLMNKNVGIFSIFNTVTCGSVRRIRTKGRNQLSRTKREKMPQRVCFSDCKLGIELTSVIDSPTSIHSSSYTYSNGSKSVLTILSFSPGMCSGLGM